VPPGLRVAGEEQQFCCIGCRRVYALLHECGLERYYAFRGASEATPQPASSSDRDYAEFDTESFQALYCRPSPEGMRTIDLYLEGVHCAACVWLVEKLPTLLQGVQAATLDFVRRVVRVTYDPTALPLSRIARQLSALGYPPHAYRGSSDMERQRQEERALLMRVGVAGAVAGNVMLLAFALYSGLFDGMSAQFQAFFRWGSLLISVPAIFWSGSIFFKGAWASLKTRTPHMDLPVSIGILAGFAWGALGTLLGKGEIYFDSVTMLIFALLVGRWIQHRQQRSAFEAAELLGTLTPSTARLVQAGDDGRSLREVPAESVPEGALVEVRTGETIPVDGCVEEGASCIDTAVLTGESLPVEVRVGATVHAGATNLTAPLLVRCTRAGANTRVGQLMQRVEEAARRRAPIVRLADRIAGYLVVVALVLAAVTLVGWSFVSVERAIDHTVALLVVACPCGLGLATPLVVSAALARAARRGLLVKGGDALEKLATPGTFVFDKTGTLTAGQVRLVEFAGPAELGPAIVALESRSAHPVARAFVAALGSENAETDSGSSEQLDGRALPMLPDVEDVEEVLGGGMSGRVGGRLLCIGSERMVRARGVEVPEFVEDATRRLLERGHSPVWIAVEGRVEAVAGFGDPLRGDAAQSLVALRELGYRLVLLSGDHPEAVAHAAAELESDARSRAALRGPLFDEVLGGRSPEQKLEYVEGAHARGPVFMVGDGVNDAAALSAASVGIAVHGGAEASLLAADVFARRAGIAPVLELVQGARRTLSVLRRGLGVSLLYNALGLTLAVAGLISPLFAAVLMPLSSLTVVSNAYRSKTFGVDP
jgi:Cu2+-exporting ATPase